MASNDSRIASFLNVFILRSGGYVNNGFQPPVVQGVSTYLTYSQPAGNPAEKVPDTGFLHTLNLVMAPLTTAARFLPLILAFGLAGCGAPTGSASKEAAFDSVKVAVYSGNTAVAMTHEVRDFESYVKAYRSLSDPESRISIFSSPEDPNLITVFELTKSHQEAASAFRSPEFRKSLEAEGVTTEPTISYFDVKLRVATPTEKLYRLGVSHEVTDYEHWKKVFDEDHPIRAKADLELRAISTSADNPSMVNIMFATDDIEKAKKVINSEELRKRMQEAGVRTEPVFAVFRVPAIPQP